MPPVQRRNRPSGAAKGTPDDQATSEPAGEDPKLIEYLKVKFDTDTINKDVRALLEKPVKVEVKQPDGTGNVQTLTDSVIELYEIDSDYARWFTERADYFRGEVTKGNLKKSPAIRRLANAAHWIAADKGKLSYYAWREQQGQGMVPEHAREQAPVKVTYDPDSVSPWG